MSGQKVLPLYWPARLLRGYEAEELDELASSGELTEQHLEDPKPWPILVMILVITSGERTLCFFDTRERVMETFEPFFKVGETHPITGDPITKDDFQVCCSGDVDELIVLCNKAELEHGATRGIINPPPEFFEPHSAVLGSSLSEIKEQIRRKGEQSAW